MNTSVESQPVRQILSRESVVLPVLTCSDLADIPISRADVLAAVRDAYLQVVHGSSVEPAKIMMRSARRDAVTYTMSGDDGGLRVAAFKTSYTQTEQEEKKKYLVISLYDDKTGLPIALMDGTRVTHLRTAATTALIASVCASDDARTALVVGSGGLARETFPYLLAAMPNLDRLLLFATHPDGIASVRAYLREQHQDRDIELVTDPEKAAGEADIMVATSAGPATEVKLRTSWLKPGALFISIDGSGVHTSSLRDADYVVVTSAAHMAVTGTHYADEDGSLRMNAELPNILAGQAPGRREQSDRVFAGICGMVTSDIPVAHTLATQAIARGRGQEIPLWG